tara:strand:- start:10469 stop:11341 length:873 start_codon:yes stop_codon:yes gene_type:complete
MSAKKSNEDKAKKPTVKKPVAKKKAMVKKEDVVAFDVPVVDPIIIDEEQVIDGAKENAQIAKAMSETKSPEEGANKGSTGLPKPDLSDLEKSLKGESFGFDNPEFASDDILEYIKNDDILEHIENDETINPNSELVEHIKEIRKNADRMQKIILGNRNIFSPSLNDSMNNGRAWLGKLLGSIGTKNPYNVDVKTAFDIPPATDVVKKDKEIAADIREFSLLSPLEAVLEAREGISSLCKSIDQLSAMCVPGYQNNFFKDNRHVAICITNSWSNYCEVNFELGYKLGKLRK